MLTETEQRFRDTISELVKLNDDCVLTVKDGNRMIELCDNLLMRYQQIRDSRDNWKDKFKELESKCAQLKN